MKAELDITQAEAETLISLEKHRITEEIYDFPYGGSLIIPLQSSDRREQFFLDINKARINLVKRKYQLRARQNVVLVRLDFGGPPHRNPNDEEIPCPHLHIFREGQGDKWAIPVPPEWFFDLSNLQKTLDDFLRYCNITRPPHITWRLFL